MSDQCPGSPGDVIIFPRTTHNHFAINVGNNNVVHVTLISDNPGSLDKSGICCITSDKIAEIKKEKFRDVWKPFPPYVETNWKGKTPLENSEVVKRALSKVGNKGYSVLYKNCEHFAHWCRYDEEGSDQADGLKKAGVVTGMALGAAVAYALSRHEDKRQHRQVGENDQQTLDELNETL